jgi:NADH:ubiquinone reductase (H+-translocating)
VTNVMIVGAGFAGLNAAKRLSGVPGIEVTLIDRENHHLFQPLLYQVAMAALSPADIAVPIRSLFTHSRNVRVLKEEVQRVDVAQRRVIADHGEHTYDYLLLATGAQHAYFGHDDWEPHAPGLKNLSQATEIRRRVLEAFEAAEREPDAPARRKHLTFVVVGGGPTGVELAGALGELSRYTLTRDFRSIDPRQTRIMLIEAGPRILMGFDDDLAARAMRDLESLGVQVWTHARVTQVSEAGVTVGDEDIASSTVLWAAGVRASPLARTLAVPLDNAGRVIVKEDFTIPDHPEVFVAGDLALAKDADGTPLPGVGAVAIQQGEFFAAAVRADLAGKSRPRFRYRDKGSMATIGRARAIADISGHKLKGRFAWWVWLLVHIYYLSGFRNRLSVLLQWAWSYFTYGRGARLIVGKEWRLYRAEQRVTTKNTESTKN